MLSYRRRRNEALLIERFWANLRRDRATPVPRGLDPELGRVIAEVERDLRPPRLTDTSIEQLWQRVEARAPETTRSGWSGPAIDPTARRRTGAPPTDEREEQQIMSDHTQTADIEPIPIQQRRWLRETLKFVAAAIVFIAIGVVLTLTLRGDDEPALGPSGPTPTVEPTATPAAIVPAPTGQAATATTEPASTVTAQSSPTLSLPSFGEIAASIQVGRAPRNMAVGEGAAWVTNADDGTVSRIDLETNEVVATIQVAPAGQVAVDAIAVGAGSVWVTTQGSIQLARIDPATNEVVATFSLGTAVHELVFGGDALWGRGSFSNTIVRVDPATNTVAASIDVPPPFAIAYLDGALWSVSESTVTKIDTATNTVVATVPIDAPSFTITAAGGSIWLAPNSPEPELVQIDPVSATVIARHPLPEQLVDIIISGASDVIYICPCRTESEAVVWRFDTAALELDALLDIPDAQWIAYGGDILWSVSQATGVVTRVNVSATATAQPSPTTTIPTRGPIVTTIPVGQDPQAIAVGAGSAWVTNGSDGTVSRIDPATNTVIATIDVSSSGNRTADAIAADDSAVWVMAGALTLVQIDPLTNAVVATTPVDLPIDWLVLGDGALWTLSPDNNLIRRFDPATNSFTTTVQVDRPQEAVVTEGALWVLHDVGRGTSAEILKLDPATGAVIATISLDEYYSHSVLVEGDSLWVPTNDSALLQIDVATSHVTAFPYPEAVGNVPLIATGNGNVWVCDCTNEPDDVVWQFDIGEQQWIAGIAVGDVPWRGWLVFLADALWSYNEESEVVRYQLAN